MPRGPRRLGVLLALALAVIVPQAGAAEPDRTFVAAADTYALASQPSSNFGAAASFETDQSPPSTAFVRFEVADLVAAVSQARLRLYVTGSSGNGPKIYRSAPGWSETGLNWDNRPGRLGGAVADIGAISSGGWVEWDVTAAVAGNGPVSFELAADSSDGADFSARETGARAPQLIVSQATATTSPSATTTSSTSSTSTTTTTSAPSGDGVIRTIAGSSTSGSSGDGGPAISARLNAPRTATVDRQGNIYFVDTLNNKVRKIDTAGRITTVGGTGTAGYSGDGGLAVKAKFDTPHGLDVDPDGNLYIADPPNQRIRRIDAATGIVTTVAGNGTGGLSGDGGPATSARINYPKGVAVGPDGNLYIADNNNHRVRRVDMATGVITTVAGTSAGFAGDGGQARSAKLDEVRNLAFDPAGNMYLVDQNNGRVRKVDPAGVITTFAGDGGNDSSGDGGLATKASLDLPRDVATDAAGNVYIVEENGNRVRRVDSLGVITTVAGTGTSGFSGDGGQAANARLKAPRGIAWDPVTSSLVIADTSNHRIRTVRHPG